MWWGRQRELEMHFTDNGKGTYSYKDGHGKQEGEHVCVPESSTWGFSHKRGKHRYSGDDCKRQRKGGKRKTEEQPLILSSTVKGATFAFIARGALSSVVTPEGQTRRSRPIPRSWKKHFASEKSDSLASFLGTYLKAQVSEFVLTTAPRRVFFFFPHPNVIFR